LRALVEVASELGDVVVVAPDSPQSGMGHAITIMHPIRLEQVDEFPGIEAYQCSGTPVDCVKLAMDKILPRKPHLCVSGINHGSNVSVNVLYSGTMSAATEAALVHIPAIGFSLCDYRHAADMKPAQHFVRILMQHVLKSKLPEGSLLNVNIPALPLDELKGYRVCRQADANWEEEFDEREDPFGRKYFWLTGRFKSREDAEDTDVHALDQGYVSVVPVKYDMTAYETIDFIHDAWNTNPTD
jgi:5''/3''-nucleotidase SurE